MVQLHVTRGTTAQNFSFRDIRGAMARNKTLPDAAIELIDKFFLPQSSYEINIGLQTKIGLHI